MHEKTAGEDVELDLNLGSLATHARVKAGSGWVSGMRWNRRCVGIKARRLVASRAQDEFAQTEHEHEGERVRRRRGEYCNLRIPLWSGPCIGNEIGRCCESEQHSGQDVKATG